MSNESIRDVQNKILEIMIYIDKICRENKIEYFIMGGTALGAVRHGGFIPWDDDLDIFMTPNNYKKFKKIFNELKNNKFIIQEWKIVDEYLEYSKVRMNGTTFIEKNFINNKDMHHGIYVDIMILHKIPRNKFLHRIFYYQCKYVTLVALSQRNWKPKSNVQKIVLKILKFLPNKLIARLCYKNIYKYTDMEDNYDFAYYITPANFKEGFFPREVFESMEDIKFEECIFKGPKDIKKYLEIRYGDYMKIPSIEQQKMSVHAEIYDTKVGYESYIE